MLKNSQNNRDKNKNKFLSRNDRFKSKNNLAEEIGKTTKVIN